MFIICIYLLYYVFNFIKNLIRIQKILKLIIKYLKSNYFLYYIIQVVF